MTVFYFLQFQFTFFSKCWFIYFLNLLITFHFVRFLSSFFKLSTDNAETPWPKSLSFMTKLLSLPMTIILVIKTYIASITSSQTGGKTPTSHLNPVEYQHDFRKYRNTVTTDTLPDPRQFKLLCVWLHLVIWLSRSKVLLSLLKVFCLALKVLCFTLYVVSILLS